MLDKGGELRLADSGACHIGGHQTADTCRLETSGRGRGATDETGMGRNYAHDDQRLPEKIGTLRMGSTTTRRRRRRHMESRNKTSSTSTIARLVLHV